MQVTVSLLFYCQCTISPESFLDMGLPVKKKGVHFISENTGLVIMASTKPATCNGLYFTSESNEIRNIA